MHTVVRLEDERAVELRVEADWAEIRPDYDHLVSSYGALAVPGFRPGRAPGKQVERHFRKEIRADVVSRCVERLSRQAIEAEKLNPVGPVSVSDVELEPGRPFRFLARFTRARCFGPGSFFSAPARGLTAADPRGYARGGRSHEMHTSLIPWNGGGTRWQSDSTWP
jgi:hypothetical protein